MSLRINPYSSFKSNQIYSVNEKVPTLVQEYLNSNAGISQKPVAQVPSTVKFPPKMPRPALKSPKVYHLGENLNGVRLIGINSVYEDYIKSSGKIPCDYQQGNPILQKRTNTMNGEIEDFMQGKRGDCYFLAALYAIKTSKEGKNILKNNIEYNKDGSVTVTLPGAIKAKEGYIKDGESEKCFITGKYKITKEAINKAVSLAGKSYAFGDLDVIISELAFEAYNAEVHITNFAMGQTKEPYIPGQNCGGNRADTLSFGQMYDAAYILTGKKSELYEIPKTTENYMKIKPYIPGEYGYVKDDSSDKKLMANYKKPSRKDEKEVTVVYNKESDLQKMLDKYSGTEKDYALTVAFVCGFRNKQGKIQKGGGHALSVTKITKDYVEVANPYDTSKKERIPRDDFEKMATKFAVTKM